MVKAEARCWASTSVLLRSVALLVAQLMMRQSSADIMCLIVLNGGLILGILVVLVVLVVLVILVVLVF